MAGNRGALGDLNDAAIQFLTNNAADIVGKNIVPDNFFTHYQTTVERFQIAQTDYINAVNDVKDLTTDNADANNDIYQEMTQGIDEAKIVFVKDAAQSDYFSVSNFLFLVSGAAIANSSSRMANFSFCAWHNFPTVFSTIYFVIYLGV